MYQMEPKSAAIMNARNAEPAFYLYKPWSAFHAQIVNVKLIWKSARMNPWRM